MKPCRTPLNPRLPRGESVRLTGMALPGRSRTWIPILLTAHFVLATSCLTSRRDTPDLHAPTPATWIGPLTVLPAPAHASGEADQNLAAALWVAYALEASQPAAVVQPLLVLLERIGAGGSCLLELQPDASCLARLNDRSRLEVEAREHTLHLTLVPGGEARPVVLPPLALDAPLESAGPALMQILALRPAPPPRDPGQHPHPEWGHCLQPDQLEPFGRALRPLLAHRVLPALPEGPLEEPPPPPHAPAESTGTAPNHPSPAEVGAELRRLAASSPSRWLLAWAELSDGEQDTDPAHFEGSPPCGYAWSLEVRGRALLKQGVADGAALMLGLSALQRPYSPDAAVAWAEALRLQGRTRDAVQVWRRALSLEPAALRTRRRLAEDLLALDRPDDGRSVLLEGRNHHPSGGARAWLELDLASLALGLDEPDRALLHLAQARLALSGLEASTTRGSLEHTAGMAHVRREEHALAERAFAQAATHRERALRPEDAGDRKRLADSIYNRGVELARLERWSESRVALHRAATLYPEEEAQLTRLDYARLLSDAGRHAQAYEALEAFQVQEGELSSLVAAHFAFLAGVTLSHREEVEAARAALQAAAEGFRGLEEAVLEAQSWYNLGRVEEQAGAPEAARDAYLRARALALELADYESLPSIDERLRGLQRALPDLPP